MKKVLVLCCILGLSAGYSVANPLGGLDAGALNSQSVRDLQLHDNITRAKAKDNSIIKAKNAEAIPRQIGNADIKNIAFTNNSAISSAELFNVVRDKIDTPMNVENLSSIRKAVARSYQQRGFFSAIVTVAQEDYKTGTVVIDIKEGMRNSITVE